MIGPEGEAVLWLLINIFTLLSERVRPCTVPTQRARCSLLEPCVQKTICEDSQLSLLTTRPHLPGEDLEMTS